MRFRIPARRSNIIRANSSSSSAPMKEKPNGTRTNMRRLRRKLPPPINVYYMDQDDVIPEQRIAQMEMESHGQYPDLTSSSNEESIERQVTISPVDAYYAAKTIDLAALLVSDFTRDATLKKLHTKEYILVKLAAPSGNSRTRSGASASYVAVYRFGSVIFFNVSPRVQARLLNIVKRYATEPIGKGFEARDKFGVCIMPHAEKTKVTAEHCIVRRLNMSAVAVISEVMAQSVALDSYDEIVDSLLDKFSVLNSGISNSNQMDLDKKMLFSKIAQNNRIFIDLISKLRIKGRNQFAWDQGEYEVIHSGMTVEFDIDDRFELIQFKLDLIQQNSKLFLEVIQHQKSASLEWIIVVLIGFECVLMCLDMSGQGEAIFASIKNILP